MTKTHQSNQKTTSSLLTQACTQQKQTIHSNQLPLSCPNEGNEVWNAHPRVFLPIEKTGEETCPYCGTVYILKD